MADFLSLTPDGGVQLDLKKAFRSGAMDQVKYLSHDEYRDQEGATRIRVEIALNDALSALIQLSRGYGLPKGLMGTTAVSPEEIETEIETSEEKLNRYLDAAKNVVDWRNDINRKFELERTEKGQPVIGDNKPN